MIPENIITRVLNAVDGGELIRFTGELVRINSVWDPAAGTSEEPAADAALNWARQAGFDVQRDLVAAGRPNVIVRWPAGPGSRTLMFEAHTDVVTPGDPAAWGHDPFGAQVVANRMYGRGTNDTKGNLAAMLVAMAALKRSAVPLAGTLMAGVLCDEEDQMLGVQDFIARGHADTVTGAIICEPQDGLLCTAQKGAIRARYTLTGKMSHGAMPLTGVSTAPAVAHLIQGLHAMEVMAIKNHGQDPLLGWPSYTPTVIQSPARGIPQLNVVPREAEVLVDVRTTPAQSHPAIRQALKTLADDAQSSVVRHYANLDAMLGIKRPENVGVAVAFLTDRPCTVTDQNDPVVGAADWATRRITGCKPQYAGVPGATDGTFLWDLKQIPIVTMGAGDRHVPHQIDEWVDLDQLVETAKIYALTALHYLYPGESP